MHLSILKLLHKILLILISLAKMQINEYVTKKKFSWGMQL